MTSPATPRRRRWRRIGARVLIVVVGVGLVLPASMLIGLRIPAVRGAIVARVSSSIESRTGVRLAARDFRVRLRAGVIEIDDLSLTAARPAGVVPFLTVRRARAVVRWRTLLDDRPIIDSLSAANPRLNLRAPLPTGGNNGGTDTVDVEVLDLDVAGGELVGAEAPDSMDVWLDRWHADGLRIRGAYRSGRLMVGEASARVVTDSHRRAPVELHVDASISADTATGSLTVDTLRVHGEGLTLEAHGRLAIDDARLAFDLEVEPARVFPDLAPSGTARASGELLLARAPPFVLDGALRVYAADFPVELASPLLEGVDVGGVLSGNSAEQNSGKNSPTRWALDS